MKRAEREAAYHTAAMGMMGAGLAHELKTPLSTIDMNLQLLQEEWADPVSEREVRSAKRVKVIVKSLNKINQIISSFVRFAQDRPLQLERVDLNALVQELLQTEVGEVMSARGGVGKIQITCDLARDLPLVEADRVLIRQALLNLVTNAIEAIPERGAVSIRTSREGDMAFAAVGDSGRGILPEHMDKIWNLYFTTKPSGIGMGLPIVKRFVEAHGGSVKAESRPGRGSTFTMYLPLSRA